MTSIIKEVRAVFAVIDTVEVALDPVLLVALKLAEDRRFAIHKGVDPIAIFRALFRWIVFRKLEGASTIEAQLFRTISGRREISFVRKLREAIAASFIALRRRKGQIATAYLTVAYFGFQKRGVIYAAQKLGYDYRRLSSFEACDLVARLKRPSGIKLGSHTSAGLWARVAWLERKMQQAAEPRLVDSQG